MSYYENQLSSIFTILSVQLINTGNRSLDNAIIALITIAIGQVIHYLINDYIRIFNMIVYYIYKVYKNPLNIHNIPFIYETTIDKNDFEKQYKKLKSITGLMYLYSNSNGSNGSNDNASKLFYNKREISNYISDHIMKNNFISIKKNDNDNLVIGTPDSGYTLLIMPFSEKNTQAYLPGMYLFTIDYSGYPIYYSSHNGSFYFKKESNNFVNEYIQPFLFNIFDKILKNDISNTNNVIFSYKKQEEKTGFILRKIGNISEKKTFDTLFYPQKKELINILDKFKTKTLYPVHVPMDNKLGIMLYGPPGTGKTGTISAIANYLNRNLTIIDFTQIYKSEELDIMLDESRFNETIFVFDEFDYLLDALVSSSSNNASCEYEETNSNLMPLLMASEGEERKQILSTIKENMNKKKSTFNISYLLQKLDGLESANGRIIIATTNNPDKINPTLMRPGRFDIKICLNNCTQHMYEDILENFYENEENVKIRVSNAKIPTYKYSPLEIINLAMQYNNLDTLLHKLLS
jgi:hypothetical protein